MDEYALEDITWHNAIQAGIFVPFVIARLKSSAIGFRGVDLQVQLRNVGESGERQRILRLVWSAKNAMAQMPPVQDYVVTEWAAVGIACVLIPLYTEWQVLQVTQVGDSFDYWVGDKEQEYALEVSGTFSGSLEARHTAKVRQLRQNLYGVSGYVVVVRFVSREVIFSFHHGSKEVG